MKVIDIIQKIANGEEVRFRIIQADEIYRIRKGGNLYSETCEKDVKWYIDEFWLNYEAEIIEEEKKIPEKLYGIANPKEGTERIPNNEELMFKINEILDYLKNKGE